MGRVLMVFGVCDGLGLLGATCLCHVRPRELSVVGERRIRAYVRIWKEVALVAGMQRARDCHTAGAKLRRFFKYLSLALVFLR